MTDKDTARGEPQTRPTLMEGNPRTYTPEEIRRVFHDLQVHQLELEMQNEELLQTQESLEASRTEYFELYDLAPVGYMTVDDKGMILKVNLWVCNHLRENRMDLVNRPLSKWIVRQDEDLYFLFRKRFMAGEDGAECTLRMVRRGGECCWVHFSSVSTMDTAGRIVMRLAMSDVTKIKESEEQIRGQLEELQRWQDVMLNREDRVQELKREVNVLCGSLGLEARYPSQAVDAADAGPRPA